MSELASAYPTAGGPYWWAAKLGGPQWSWFTGWFNVIGLLAVVASVDYAAATFGSTLFNLWGLDLGVVNFADDVHARRGLRRLRRDLLVIHALINIYSSHLVALFNNISVFWHVVGVVVIIAILVFVPDRHQNADFVFTETFNNSGFSDGSTSNGFFWFYVLPLGFLLTMYTVTGYDASAHVAEETREAELSAAKGIWQSVFFSAVIGWFVLLAITFAAVDIDAINEAGGYSPAVFTSAMSEGWAETVILISFIGQIFCGMACVTSASRTFFAFSRDRAVPGWRFWSSVNAKRVPGGGCARRLRAVAGHHHSGALGHLGRHPGGVLRGRVDRGHRPLHRVRHAGLSATARRKRVHAGSVDARWSLRGGSTPSRSSGWQSAW